VKSVTTSRFRKCLSGLPEDVKGRTITAFQLWRTDPSHPSLVFRQVHPTDPIYSVRIGLHYRALAVVEDGVAIWFWVGSHSDYDKLLSAL
jgi:hypothetical protein